ncbi:MAG: glycosyltransferase family 39 protein, partial [Verrucomicrobia bacterium]|nr:glycosyltransferase family 39 protein [Verrucomicrobiota bacterium]
MLLLSVFGVVAAACLVGGFWLIEGDYTLLLVKHGGYWLLLFTFLVFLQSVFQNRKTHFRNPKGIFLAHKWVFLAAGLAVGVYFLLQDAYFKITMDEVVLASTSMHMHLEKEVFTVSRGYEVNGVFYILGGYLDKRPYFFAFLVSLVHDLFGYRPGNVFYVNAAISFFLLVGMFFVGKLFGGKRWGWLAMLLLISLPLFGINVTGGGFELFNLLMILITVYLAKCWVEKPSANSLISFTYSGLLLAQCRYESILFVIPVGLLILYVWWRDNKVMLPWPMFFAPLILVPYILQNRVLNETKVLWQLEDYQSAPFGFQYLSLNFSSAREFFFQVGNDQGNSLLILGLTLLSIVLWLVYKFHYGAYYPKEKTSWRPVAWIFGLTILFNFGLLMFYYWGQLNDPAASRLGLPLHLALIFFIVFVLSR